MFNNSIFQNNLFTNHFFILHFTFFQNTFLKLLSNSWNFIYKKKVVLKSPFFAFKFWLRFSKKRGSCGLSNLQPMIWWLNGRLYSQHLIYIQKMSSPHILWSMRAWMASSPPFLNSVKTSMEKTKISPSHFKNLFSV